VTARTRRRLAQGARWALVGALIAGGVAVIVVELGESLWALTAPPDRQGLFTAQVEPGLTSPRAPGVEAGVTAPMTRTAVLSTPGAGRNAASPVAGERLDAVARVGARSTLAGPAPTEAVADAPDLATAPGEPAVTMEVQGGRTVYRMNGDLVVDPDRQREDLVEAGVEYRFGLRGLEKVKLWEVRR